MLPYDVIALASKTWGVPREELLALGTWLHPDVKRLRPEERPTGQPALGLQRFVLTYFIYLQTDRHPASRADERYDGNFCRTSRIMGYKEHTSVRWAVRRVLELLDRGDPQTTALCQQLETAIATAPEPEPRPKFQPPAMDWDLAIEAERRRRRPYARRITPRVYV